MLRVVYVLVSSRCEKREGVLQKELPSSRSLFLSRRPVTHWISARNALLRLRGSLIHARNLSGRHCSLPLPFAPVFFNIHARTRVCRWNCSIVARDDPDKLKWWPYVRWSVNNVNIFTTRLWKIPAARAKVVPFASKVRNGRIVDRVGQKKKYNLH